MMATYADETLTEMLEGSPIGAAILEVSSGERLFVNTALVRMFGASSREEMLNRDIGESWVDPEALAEVFGVFRTGERVINVEAERRRFDGSRCWILMNTQPVTFRGQKAGIVWHVDISDRKAAESEVVRAKLESERANHAKSEFLAHMSHELRTPLNSILGYSDVLASSARSGFSDEKLTEYAQTIHTSGEHLLAIINDILDISKIEAGEYVLDETVFDLGEALGETERLLRGLADERGIEISYTPPALPHIRADERIIKQIVMNLLSNAIKFNVQDGNVRLSAAADDEGAVSISVSDTGIGIAEKDMDKVLEPFGQARSGSQRAHSGTGLGLSLSKHLTELHGGSLTLSSEIGRGTEVRVMLPPDRVASQ